MSSFKDMIQRESFKKACFFILLMIFFYAIRSIFNFVLLTFLITFLMNSMQNLILKALNNVIKIKPAVVTIILYSLMTISLVWIGIRYIPIAVNESMSMINGIQDINIDISNNELMKNIQPILKQIDLHTYAKEGMNVLGNFLTSLGKWGLNLFLAIIVSLVCLLEKKDILNFLIRFKYSKISNSYDYMKYFATNFLNSFGKVIQAQIMIAIVNTILSCIGLVIMGFPKIFALTFMIFFLSLIPVLGVIISLIPLCMIGLKIGGIIKVFYVIIMIIVIHAIESYVLNPKLMSDKTHLPVFFTFIILIVSEHFMGAWGLLLGIPLFIFILDLLGVDISEKKDNKFKLIKK